MLFDEFRKRILHYINNYMDFAAIHATPLDPSEVILFPQVAYFSQAEDGYAFELGGIGSRRKIDSKIIKVNSVVEYLDPCFTGSRTGEPYAIFSNDNVFSGFAVYPADCETFLAKSFPGNDKYYRTRFIANPGSCPVLDINESSTGLIINNSLIGGASGNIFRYHHVALLGIFHRGVTSRELHSRLNAVFEDAGGETPLPAYGLLACDPKDRRIFLATQLRSLAIRSRVLETTVGDFINKHPEVIYRAFETDSFIYEPNLPWIEHDGTVTDTAINPDLMIKRSDGFFDIIDLKRAILETQSVTRGKRNRRGFVSYVGDGIQQLANYREYFEFPANREYAEAKYGIRVRDPNLTLVVGNMETANHDEVRQAMRQYIGTRINVVDFDTVISKILR
jgi:hypothetical protein